MTSIISEKLFGTWYASSAIWVHKEKGIGFYVAFYSLGHIATR